MASMKLSRVPVTTRTLLARSSPMSAIAFERSRCVVPVNVIGPLSVWKRSVSTPVGVRSMWKFSYR